MLFLIDGIAVEFEVSVADVVKGWHRMVDDVVIENKTGKHTEIYTDEGAGRTIRTHIAKALAGRNISNWEKTVREVLGRPFNRDLDTVCLSDSGTNSLAGRKEIDLVQTGDSRFLHNYFAEPTIGVRYNGFLFTRAIEASGKFYRIRDINADIRLDIEVRKSFSGETYWNSKEIKAYLRGVGNKVLVNEKFLEATEHSKFLTVNKIREKALITLPDNLDWAYHISKEIVHHLFETSKRTIEIEVTITECQRLRSVLHSRR